MSTRRVAIVTGASRGIGAGIAAALGRAGYAVVATSRSIAPADGDDLVTVQGDLADAATAERVVAAAVGRFGRVDVLVNNAGVFVGKRFADSTAEDLAALVAVNLTGFFHVTQRVIRQLTAQGGGHVVTITTSLVDHPRSASPSALTALTKGGLAAATRALAIEHAADGIRVNAVSPGIVRTPEHDAASYDGLAALHPLGRLAEVGDVADAVLYLERATFVTGETLHVDGGQAAGG
jgi:NAD(P)-dependent dehydrogenase (short-subunit alcohol dehydrogenase family)